MVQIITKLNLLNYTCIIYINTHATEYTLTSVQMHAWTIHMSCLRITKHYTLYCSRTELNIIALILAGDHPKSMR